MPLPSIASAERARLVLRTAGQFRFKSSNTHRSQGAVAIAVSCTRQFKQSVPLASGQPRWPVGSPSSAYVCRRVRAPAQRRQIPRKLHLVLPPRPHRLLPPTTQTMSQTHRRPTIRHLLKAPLPRGLNASPARSTRAAFLVRRASRARMTKTQQAGLYLPSISPPQP